MQLVAYRNTMKNAVPVRVEREAVREEAKQQRRAFTVSSIVEEVERRRRAEAELRERLAQERAKVAETIERGRLAARRFNAAITRYCSFEEVVRRICRATGISRHDILSNRRDAQLVAARQAVMYWACRRTGMSTAQIGRLMGRDHTTVLAGKRVYVEKRAAKGRNLREVR